MAGWQRSPLFGCCSHAGAGSETHRVKVGRAAELREEEEQPAGDYLSAKRTAGRPRWSGEGPGAHVSDNNHEANRSTQIHRQTHSQRAVCPLQETAWVRGQCACERAADV